MQLFANKLYFKKVFLSPCGKIRYTGLITTFTALIAKSTGFPGVLAEFPTWLSPSDSESSL